MMSRFFPIPPALAIEQRSLFRVRALVPAAVALSGALGLAACANEVVAPTVCADGARCAAPPPGDADREDGAEEERRSVDGGDGGGGGHDAGSIPVDDGSDGPPDTDDGTAGGGGDTPGGTDPGGAETDAEGPNTGDDDVHPDDEIAMEDMASVVPPREESSLVPLPPGAPGGFPAATFVFSEARMNLDGSDDDFVQLGWIEIDAARSGNACGSDGPLATRTFYAWKHVAERRGTCTKDVKNGVDFARWDHVDVEVDGCPGREGFVEDGVAATRPFLFDCPAHVPAGFGDPDARRTVVGHYQYDPAARTMVFRYDIGGSCKKEYFRDLTLDAGGTLLAMRLDGTRTGDTSAINRGIGATHGFAYGSSSPMSRAADFVESMAALHERRFISDAWRFREASALDDTAPAQPDHYQAGLAVGMRPEQCRSNVFSDHSCNRADGHAPFLAQCVSSNPRTAYLRWILHPFAATSPREQLFWAWHAHHAPNFTGCYHRGSHSNPLLQIVDANGIFRGFVGVELQRSAKTVPDGTGHFMSPPDAFMHSDYRVWRWVEDGFEEIVAP